MRLVVEGCRSGAAGFQTRCVDCWLVGWDTCTREIGPRDARRLIGDLLHFVGEAVAAAARPVALLPRGCVHLSRDECLLLAAVAGAQNDAPSVVRIAARHFAGDGAGRVEAAAGDLAEALSSVRQQLRPVPERLVEDIAARPGGTRFA